MNYKNLLFRRDKSDDTIFKHMQDTLFWTVSDLLELNGNDDLLDVGCGIGNFVPYSIPANYFGIDVSEPNIEVAEIKPQSRLFPREIEFDTMDILNMDLRDSIFDKVSCIEVLEHLTIPEICQTLKEMVRVTVPGGIIVITVPNLYYLWGIIPWSFKPIRRRMTFKGLFEGMKKGYVEEIYHQRHYRFKPEFMEKLLSKYMIVEGSTTSFWYNNRTIHDLFPTLQMKIHKFSWRGNHKLGNNIIFKLRNNKGMVG